MWPEGLARPTTANIQLFTTRHTGAATVGNWQAWNKPAGCSFVYIIACGGGGGGGKGNGNAATVGSGGGGSGVLIRALFSAFLLPDILFFRIGIGGARQTTVGGTGNAGAATTLALTPEATSTVSNILLLANGGSGGGGAATSTAGAAGVVPTSPNQILSNLGFWQASSRAGTAGGTVANGSGTDLTVQGGGLIVMGGTGGGNGTGRGGNITVITEFKTWVALSGGIGAPTSSAGASAIKNSAIFNAITTNAPLVFQGGAGGGGASLATAGAGGSGSWGCGGGGGGNTSGAGGIPGDGGSGGDGFAIVLAF